MNKRVMVIYGTRPEAVKLAPIIHQLSKIGQVEPIVVVSAQHREMLDQVNELFGITPDYDLNIITPRQSLVDVTVRALRGLSDTINTCSPDAVIVQGDTTTTFAGALAAFYARLPVVHVEAGLRTGDRYSPFPEEVNRRLTTELTTLHLAPTAMNRESLLAQGVSPSSVLVTGNPVIDALFLTLQRDRPYVEPELRRLDEDDRDVLLVTAHRRESWGQGMTNIASALAEIAAKRPTLLVVLPIHKNPAVRESMLPVLSSLDNVLVLEPLSYASFCRLMNRSKLILSDSGGIQEEGPSLGKPVLVMRDTTERQEALAAGTARLVGTSRRRIVEQVELLLDNPEEYRQMATAINPYGDGYAAERCAQAACALVGLGDAPPEFSPAYGVSTR